MGWQPLHYEGMMPIPRLSLYCPLKGKITDLSLTLPRSHILDCPGRLVVCTEFFSVLLLPPSDWLVLEGLAIICPGSGVAPLELLCCIRANFECAAN